MINDSILITEAGFIANDWASRSKLSLAELNQGIEGIGDAVLYVEGDADPDSILPYIKDLSAISIYFSTFSDGRGFSLARALRDGGFKGKLQAEGEIVPDQLRHVRQLGFDRLVISAERAERMTEDHWIDVAASALPSYQMHISQKNKRKPI